jgi:hypothetical protein
VTAARFVLLVAVVFDTACWALVPIMHTAQQAFWHAPIAAQAVIENVHGQLSATSAGFGCADLSVCMLQLRTPLLSCSEMTAVQMRWQLHVHACQMKARCSLRRAS